MPADYCQLPSQRRRDYRIGMIVVFFIIFSLLIVAKLFKLQVLENNYYLALASGQHEIFKNLYPERGAIYVFDGNADETAAENEKYYPVAFNQKKYLLYVIPKDIKDPEAALGALKEVFDVKVGDETEPPPPNSSLSKEQPPPNPLLGKEGEQIAAWQAKLTKKDDPYEPLKHFVTEEEIEKIKNYNLEGFGWIKELERFYPEKNIGGQLFGYVGKQPENNALKGYYGLEGCYDKELAGEPGFLRSELDTLGRWIAIAGKDLRQAKDGDDLILTIDRAIQYFSCNALNNKVKELSAEAGSLIVMEPASGKILALCDAPDFDPNEYNKVKNLGVFMNAAISKNYEPGSVFKPITMAGAIDSGKVDPFTTYFDSGELIISGHSIKNSDLQSHGVQTMTQVLEKSLNTGAIFAARKLGIAEFKKYVDGFGFGHKTEIDLCQEETGNIKSLDENAEIYLATASFGQGITVTPIQLVRAFAAIANEGKLVQPYVIERVLDGENIVKQTSERVVNQVISPETAKLIGSMLVSVVRNGHAKKAGVPGYLVAGKTGTAQVPDLVHGGYSDKTIHTFVGFAPFNQPRFVMLTKIDNPQGVKFAESSAVPLFRTVAKFILDYYHVAPEEK
ncbi:penicillin-binding protein 2 [Candidatus Falkowbacteria bacterium]|nr:penicillin-binding protein 2 [Candidatus Falkowbacteria bacterium]